MNRRNLLLGITATPITLILGKHFAIASGCNYISYTNNKLGMGVSYSNAMAVDLWDIHGINIETIYKNMYGTQFFIEKEYRPNLKKLFFTLNTNNIADGKYSWYESEKYQQSFKNRTKDIVCSFELSHKLHLA